jgi:hypothetical protein
MKLEFAIFANTAQVAEDGTINMVGGGFDILQAAAFPATVQQMTLVARVLVSPGEFSRKHTLQAKIVGPGGKVIRPAVSSLPRSATHATRSAVTA